MKKINELTVLMTVYNGMPYLKEAVQSTLDQSYTNFEFLIIDDFSTDGSIDYLESLKDERIRLFKNSENLGQVKSLNIGLKKSNAKYIARLDQDDINLPDRFKNQLNFMEGNENISLISSYEYGIDENGKILVEGTKDIKNFGHFIAEILLGLCPVWHPSVMFKRSTVESLNYFNENLGPSEDYDLWTRFALNREGAAIVKEFDLKARNHNNRQSIQLESKQKQKTSEIHLDTLNKILGKNKINLSLNSFLMMNQMYKKQFKGKHLKDTLIQLNFMRNTIARKFDMTEVEEKEFNKRLVKRLGLGIKLNPLMRYMPNQIFTLLFNCLSPVFLIKTSKLFDLSVKARNLYSTLKVYRKGTLQGKK